MATALLMVHSLVAPVDALPVGTDENVVHGSATIETNGPNMTINQVDEKIVINWNSFDINAGESVTFNQPSATAVALNRVLSVDQSKSQIDGVLSANGRVFIVNPNGVVFGSGAQVNVGGLVASTLDISDADFLNELYRFTGNGGNVDNLGNIVANGGYAILIGRRVSNEGTITAEEGSVALAAGSSVELVVGAGGRLTAQVNAGAADALVENKATGEIVADGGMVLLTAKELDAVLDTVINNEGVVRARSLFGSDSGVIKLVGGMDGGTVHVGGTLDASATRAGSDGGQIETSGFRVNVAEGAQITTDVLLGWEPGEWLIRTHDVVIAGESLESDDNRSFVNVDALGAALTGANVVIEAHASDALGHEGDILVNGVLNYGGATNAGTLTLRADDDIAFIDSVQIHAGDIVTLRADWDADGNGTVTLGESSISTPDWVYIFYNPVSYDHAETRSDRDRNPYIPNVSAALTAYMLVNDVDDLQAMNSNLLGFYALGKDIDATGYEVFEPIGAGSADGFVGILEGDHRTIKGLQINRPGESSVGLFSSLNPSDDSFFFAGEAMVSNLTLTDVSVVGGDLVGALAGAATKAVISNVHVSGSVSGSSKVGGLVGSSEETAFEEISAHVNVSGTEHVGGAVGYGLLGFISRSSIKGTVTQSGGGAGGAGGVIGWADGDGPESFEIYATSFEGTVTGTDYVGGLVGGSDNLSSDGVVIVWSSADAVVIGRDYVGGLVGSARSAALSEVYSVGLVRGQNAVGGLAGTLLGTRVENAYSMSAVHGDAAVGGLVGEVQDAMISSTYSTGAVTGAQAVGGLIGRATGDQVEVHDSYWDTDTSGIENDAVGEVDDPMEGVILDITGLSTSALQAELPEGFDDARGEFGAVWRIIEGISYPYLRWRYPAAGPSVVSGTVEGVDGGNGYLTVGMALGGRSSGARHSGANGYFYTMFDPPEQDVPVIVWLGGANTQGESVEARGNALTFTSGGHATGITVRNGYVTVTNHGPTLSGILGGAVEGIEDLDDHEGILYRLGSFIFDPDINVDITVDSDDFLIDEDMILQGSGSLLVDVKAGSLEVAAGISAQDGTITLLSAGDVTLSSGGIVTLGVGPMAGPGSITSGASGDAIVISAVGDFLNYAGPGSVSATGPGGRWLIYAADPETSVFGDLDSGNTAIWNATYATKPPASVTQPGNRYLFAYQPTLVFASANRTKTYGTALDLSGAYEVTGYHEGVANAFLGDTAATAFAGAPELWSDGAAADAPVFGSPYTIFIEPGSVESDAGYHIVYTSNGLLTVNPAMLIVRVKDANRLVGTENPPFEVEFIGFVLGQDVDDLSGELIVTTEATIDSPPGIYDITAAGSTFESLNYVIVYESGKLTVFAPSADLKEILPNCNGVVSRYVDEGEARRMSYDVYCGFHAFPAGDAPIDVSAIGGRP